VNALVFMDTECTGLSLDDDIWEFAAIRRDPDGSEHSLHLFIDHDREKCARLPESFRTDHYTRWPGNEVSIGEDEAAQKIVEFTGKDRPHVVGAVPNFDTERLALLLGRYGHKPGWHYHLIDVENLAVGYLAGRASLTFGEGWWTPPLPWDSDDLSRAVGVEPPTDERHTAMGDVRWCMALYDAITGAAS
jgi:hypothetical protein